MQENENLKPFWNFAKSKRRGTNNLISLNVDGSVLTDDSSIAQSINSHFSLVFTTKDYVNFPTLDCSVDKKLANIDSSVNEVKCHLLKLQTNKSPGPDHIVPCILKSCALELAPLLPYMINKSFSIGLLPDKWSHADITPLHKKGSKSSRENYHPISLTSIVLRLVKKLFLIGSSGAKLTLLTTANSVFFKEDPLQLNYYHHLMTGRNLEIYLFLLMSSFLTLPKPSTAFLMSGYF